MTFNPYNVYSVISKAEGTNEKKLENVLLLADKFKSLSGEADAKQYIQETWKLTGNVKEYLIGDGCFLSTKDTKELFTVNFKYKNENVTYYYNKGV